jgi:hypothetical protein
MTEIEKHARPWYLKFPLLHNDKHDSAPPAKPKPAIRLDFTKNKPTDIPYPPFVDVDGVPNFRDLGGYSCLPPFRSPSDQKFSIGQGYAYRCSELSQITPHGDEFLTDALRIRTLYDFRSEREAANPRGQPKGVTCISAPVFRQDDVTLTMQVQQLQWSTAPDAKNAGFSQGYVDWYRQIAIYGAKHAFRLVFQHIRDKPDEPFVFHCTAGKDRTGVFSALLLKLCGVDDGTVSWEYALTVPGMGSWEEMVEQEMVGDSMMPIRSHGGMTREEARRVCGSRAANMERWLKVVLEGEFGGATKYLRDHCGFSDGDVETIRRNLIVEGEGSIKPVEIPGSEDHPQT